MSDTETKRLFIAVDITDDAKAKISDALKQMAVTAEKSGLGVAWTKPDSQHLTLKFLGATSTKLIDDISQRLSRVCEGERSFDITLRGVGAFPNVANPRVLWVGVDDQSRSLSDIAHAIEAEMVGLGFDKETRPFSPHLTVGRVKLGRRAIPVLEPFQKAVFGTSTVRGIVLYESVLRPEGSEYRKLKIFAIASR